MSKLSNKSVILGAIGGAIAGTIAARIVAQHAIIGSRHDHFDIVLMCGPFGAPGGMIFSRLQTNVEWHRQ